MSGPDDLRERPGSDEARRELREFLVMVAEAIAAEPPRASSPRIPRSASAPPPPLSPPKNRVRGRIAVALLVVALTAIMLKLVTGMEIDPGDIPVAMQGRWRPAAAAFAGRELGLAARSITFRAGEGAPVESYPVTNHASERDAGEAAYRIEYATREGTFTIRLRVEGDELRLSNRPEVAWKRVGAE